MWEKIKEFFHKKPVIITEAVILALCSVGLLIGGISLDSIMKIPALTLAIVEGVSAIALFIGSL